jgi:hypothetical protein
MQNCRDIGILIAKFVEILRIINVVQRQNNGIMNVIEIGEHTSVSEHYPNAAPCIPHVLLEYMSDDGGWEFLPYKHLRYYKYKCPRSGTLQYI